MIRTYIHMAYLCGNSIPFEVFHSSGIKLSKIKGDGFVSYNSKCYFPTYMCSYAMNCLDIIIREEQKYDGFIFENKCHAMVALYEYLREYMPHKKLFMINIPKTNSLYSSEYYKNEVLKLINFLRNEFNVIIFENILQEKRIKLEKLSQYKKEIFHNIAINSISLSQTDIEVLDVFPGEEHEMYSVELSRLEEKAKNKFVNKCSSPEILLCGIQITPLDIIQVINDYGGKIIIYDNFENNDLIEDTERDDLSSNKRTNNQIYHKNTISNWNSGWIKIFENKLNNNNIKGIIFSTIKFCPIQSYGVILLSEIAKRNKVPFLVLNDSFSGSCSAQIHTRIQAFIECLE